ncbi:MAG: hypothetical protein F4110_14420 [Acidimicrobiaceae bacterium]|nr:hypothetical protein [Acidimicrobiaceae bacterium]MXZ98144.1 hypothetical protein [Acidimicrobiaceae bacterium]MYE76880.1 hypothetical protein [Acidimicrobiaceae bacterium]MYE95892.1 hypothetical protein [Acidimicrobiaceae bacterium]MYH44987.1 hypothetical protein [Acidimicrobiaceae bacterium]
MIESQVTLSVTGLRDEAGARPTRDPTSRLMLLLAATAGLLALTACALRGGEPAAASGDGSGHRAVTEPPATMARSVCPEYREDADRVYFWDRLAFDSAIAAEIEYCQNIDPGPLGRWVVEERFDEQGAYSISAHLDAVSHSVLHDWRGIVPTLWVSCWQLERGEERPAEPYLEVWLWHFGPPQQTYGEPTPVRYQFARQDPSDVALWWGHSGQAEVLLLPPLIPEIVEQEADSHTFAAQMRDAARANEDDDSGPILTIETFEGYTVNPRGPSQGEIEFDLVGLERAAFPVFDACAVSTAAPST